MDQERAVRAHRKLVRLIETGRGEEAERFWARHMRAVNDLQSQWLGHQQLTELLD